MNTRQRPFLFITTSLVGFALLMGITRLMPFSRLATLLFLLLILLIVLVAVTIFNLERTRRRLERQIQELDTIQAIGKSLNAHLDIESIFVTIHREVAKIIPFDTFYIALCNQEIDEISASLVMVQGKKADWPVYANPLLKRVLQENRPFLIPENVNQTLQTLHLPPWQFPVVSWLGIPLSLANNPIGIMVVQSTTPLQLFKPRHQSTLTTIASQAGIALENARLYGLADSALAQRVHELDSVVQTAEEGILLLDRDWHVVMANRALLDMMDLNGSSPNGHLISFWPAEGETIAERLGYTLPTLGADCHALVQGEKRLKKQILLASKPAKHVERTLTAVSDHHQNISGWLIVVRDISEEVELAQLRDDMTHMLVHDLRSPLFVLLGSIETAQVWLEMGKTADVQKLITLAQTSGKHLLNLLNELLDLYKLEGNEIPLAYETITPHQLLNQTYQQLAPAAAEANIKLELDIAPNTPNLFVDSGYMGRVLHNLVDNAIKFTPDNGRIRLWAKPDSQNASTHTLLGISDTGPGIPPTAQRRLFQKFQQGITQGGRRQGTGLGLPYCKLIVEAHEGKIWVESKGVPGEGTTFIITLPTGKSS